MAESPEKAREEAEEKVLSYLRQRQHQWSGESWMLNELDALIKLGEEDVRDYVCQKTFLMYESGQGLSFFEDPVLHTLVAILYIKELHKKGYLEDDRGLSSFADRLWSGEIFQGVCPEQDILGLLEDLWRSSGCEGSIFFTVRDFIWSDSFCFRPRRVEDGHGCSKVLAHARERVIHLQAEGKVEAANELGRIVEVVVAAYEMNRAISTRETFETSLDVHECKDYKSHCSEWIHVHFPQLTVQEARELMRGLLSSPLLRAIVTLRPPKSIFLTHEEALRVCAFHARLWLLKSQLPVYYNFPELAYSKLGRDVVHADELRALESECGFMERLPSPAESYLRGHALQQLICGGPDPVWTFCTTGDDGRPLKIQLPVGSDKDLILPEEEPPGKFRAPTGSHVVPEVKVKEREKANAMQLG